ncbi:phospho-N-acetylmuramoyl-pentapeptide-transferase [Leptospira brenneri]|uniref:Phospho-N-acetylmuramoyl-pentapeptide-transferase n=1 Tax=Leptospira brenneri TaxID=2023182 RepID=A0A2M9Y133_9LEPT|nr:phospho-N-acetylmuramoyl-pentapeptide-transferase [Leptospira brenneri]PJZ45262.1 phospho-N-acetylmuramoyl-pentapeptide-transferase [Leptospira brenneri]TGK91750.1 phospho-N-acetylmuramoyl-pentapeptide-transferase [Leptospira brenneri]
MFQWIYESFGNDYGFLRVFSYVTLRAMMAGLTAMFITFIFGKSLISFLLSLKFRESVRNDGPQSHAAKSGTPTMGGLIMILSLTVSTLLWGNLSNLNVLLLLISAILFAGLGFTDDYMKSVKKIKGGMRARTKFLVTIFFAVSITTLYFYFTGKSNTVPNKGVVFTITDLFLPFVKGPVWNLGLLAVPFAIIVLIGSSHAVNLTDGLDGLASGTVVIATATFALISYVSGTPSAANYLHIPYLPGSHEYAVFLAGLSGALLGFLWFNCHPAQVFMGDTGSLFLGSTLGLVAIMLKKEILLVILGGIFVAEAVSVILQVGSFKLTGKRIFKMAPLHHHFELSGWSEEKVVIRFWIIGIILAIITLSTLKIQ